MRTWCLLLPHTAYKCYPESVLTEQRWDRLTKWLGTVSTYPTDNVDLDGVEDIDQWMIRLEEAGHYVGSSSGTTGTTGKSAMLMGSAKDIEWVCKDSVTAFAWASGVPPQPTRRFFGLAPVIATPRNKRVGNALCNACGNPAKPRFDYPIPPLDHPHGRPAQDHSGRHRASRRDRGVWGNLGRAPEGDGQFGGRLR